MFVETKKEGEAPVLTEFSYHGFLAWLGKQPADATYYVGSAHRCAAGRFYQSMGRAPQVFITGIDSVAADLGFGIGDARHYQMLRSLADHPQTFGAALERLRQFCGG